MSPSWQLMGNCGPFRSASFRSIGARNYARVRGVSKPFAEEKMEGREERREERRSERVGKRANCDTYSQIAQVQADANQKYNCGYCGSEWVDDSRAHFGWCIDLWRWGRNYRGRRFDEPITKMNGRRSLSRGRHFLARFIGSRRCYGAWPCPDENGSYAPRSLPARAPCRRSCTHHRERPSGTGSARL